MGGGTTLGVSILECEAVSKAYGGLLAVHDLSFFVQPGEVFAIVGPNGAGKTTLFDTISGIAAASRGAIRFQDREIQSLRPHEICQLGLARTFQTTVTFDSQNVLTNVLIGSTFGRATHWQSNFRFTDEAAAVALEAMALAGLEDQAAPAVSLSTLERKRLMLATALATRPTLLLLDEPVGGLNAAERETMIQLIRRINATGVTVLMIEHVMKAVQALASRMLVLHHGQKIAEGAPSQVLRDVRVIDVYLGAVGAGAAGHTLAVQSNA
jgi:branched-chain amino acid transport system ATP-binding protein